MKLRLTFLLLIASLSGFAQTYIISDTTIKTCSGYFFDTGSDTAGPKSNEQYVMTFMSPFADVSLEMIFYGFDIDTDTSQTYLIIYDGKDTTAPVIGKYNAYHRMPERVAGSSNNGALTYKWVSGKNYKKGYGWFTVIRCCSGYGNQYVSLSKDRICKGDSIMLTSAIGCGRKQWQRSKDSIAWTNMEGQDDYSVKFAPSESYYYRLQFSIGAKKFYSQNAYVFVPDTCLSPTDGTSYTTCSARFNYKYTSPNSGGNTTVKYSNSYFPPESGSRLIANFSLLNYKKAKITIYSGTGSSKQVLLAVPYHADSYNYKDLYVASNSPDGSLTIEQEVWTDNSSYDFSLDLICSNQVAAGKIYSRYFNPICKGSILTLGIKERYQGVLQWQKLEGNKWIEIPNENGPIMNYQAFKTTTFRARFSNATDTVYSQGKTISIVDDCIALSDYSATLCEAAMEGDIRNSANPDMITTYFPEDTTAKKLKVLLYSFSTHDGGSLTVYNGNTTTSPVLGNYTSLNEQVTLQSTAKDGSLTFKIHRPEWPNLNVGSYKGRLSCCDPSKAPLIERKTSPNCQGIDTLKVLQIGCGRGYWQQSYDNKKWQNYGDYAEVYPVYAGLEAKYFRLLFIQGKDSTFSNVVKVEYVSCFNMQEGALRNLNTCSALFYDSGGPNGTYQYSGNSVTFFHPNASNLKMRADMDYISLDSDNQDTLFVYEGNGFENPRVFVGSTPQQAHFKSSATNGAIQFFLKSKGLTPGKGWAGFIYCNDGVKVEEQLLENNTFLLYPNPFNNELRITRTTTIQEQAAIAIYDVRGEMVGQWSLNTSEELLHPDLAQGFYTYSIGSKKDKILQRGKLVVIRP